MDMKAGWWDFLKHLHWHILYILKHSTDFMFVNLIFFLICVSIQFQDLNQPKTYRSCHIRKHYGSWNWPSLYNSFFLSVGHKIVRFLNIKEAEQLLTWMLCVCHARINSWLHQPPQRVVGSYPRVMTKQKLICCLLIGTRVLPELGMQRGTQMVVTLSLLYIYHNKKKTTFPEKSRKLTEQLF